MWVWLFNLVSLAQCHITLVLCKADPDLVFLDQTEDQRAEKIFFENSPPPISGPGWPPPPQQWSLSTTSGQLDSAQNVANGLLISLWCTTCLAEEASTCKFQRGCCLHIILRSNGSYKLNVPKAECKTHRDRAFPHVGPSQGNTLSLAIKSTLKIQSFKEVLMNFFFMWHLHTKPFHAQYIISLSSDIGVLFSFSLDLVFQ